MQEPKSKRCCSSFWNYMPTDRQIAGTLSLTAGVFGSTLGVMYNFPHNDVINICLIYMGVMLLGTTAKEELEAQLAELTHSEKKAIPHF